MCIGLVGQQNVASMAVISISRTRNGSGNGHYGVCSGWYGYWFIVNYMIGLIRLDGSALVCVICVRCVHWLGVCFVCLMGVNRWVNWLKRGVVEVQLVVWKTDNFTLCL